MGLKELKARVALLTKVEVLVGFTAETTDRQAEDAGVTNAVIAYINDQGAPEQNIPARPFMEPGIKKVEAKVNSILRAGALKAISLNGKARDVEEAFHKAGLVAQLSIQKEINSNIPPPLSPRTLAARKARGRTGTNTLVDTGQLRNAVTYAIRAKKRKRKGT